MKQKDLLGNNAPNDGICDNTDCEHKNHEFIDVKMKDEFDGDIVCWCKDCIERDKEMLENCEWCGTNRAEREIHYRTIYHPFDESPSFKGYLCEYCTDDIYWCDECGREIFESNGMRKNIRFDDCGAICVSCLQKKWFVEGMERFKDGDWFSDKDLLEHGFIEHEYYFCRAQQDYDKAEKDFDLLKEQGWLVILSIEASGMGLEHHIRIWKKEV